MSIVWDKYARRDGDTAPEKDFLVFPKYNQVKTNMQMCPKQSKLEAMVKFDSILPLSVEIQGEWGGEAIDCINIRIVLERK